MQSMDRISELNKENLPVQFELHAIAEYSFKGIDVTIRVSAALRYALNEKSTLSENTLQTTHLNSRRPETSGLPCKLSRATS